MNLDFPEQCLFCLDNVVQQKSGNEGEKPSVSCQVQNFQQLCEYLKIDFPLQSLKFKNVSRILTSDSKNSCESLLCSDCLEMVDELGCMYCDLTRIKRKIDRGIMEIQDVIKRSDECTENGATGPKDSSTPPVSGNDKGTGSEGKKRKLGISSTSSSVEKDYLEFVDTFRTLVKEVVIQEPEPMVISEETQALAEKYEKMIEGCDDETNDQDEQFLLAFNDNSIRASNSNGINNNLLDIQSNATAMDTSITTITESDVSIANSIQDDESAQDSQMSRSGSSSTSTRSKEDPGQMNSSNMLSKSLHQDSPIHFTPTTKKKIPTFQKSKAIYRCRYCEETFESVVAYYIHRKRDHPKQSEALIIPTVQSSNSKDGKEIRSVSVSAKFDTCPICGEQKGQNKNSFLQFMEHLLSHEVVVDPVTTVPGDICPPDEDKPYRCNHIGCTQRFLLEINLDLHKICYHESTLIKLKCHECGDISSKSWEDLMAHLVEEHGSQNIYSCKSCAMATTTADKILEHMQVHVLSKRLPCPECNSVAPTLKNLYQHFNEYHPNLLTRLQCDICKEVFVMPSTYRRHLSVCHPEIKTTRPTFFPNFGDVGVTTVATDTTTQNVQCPHCADVRIFKNKTTLENHIKIHHDFTVQKHKCEQCGKAFVHRSTLRYHIQQVHLRIRYNCPHCPKSFTAKSLLKGHLKLHNGVAPPLLTCSLCSKKFSSLSALKTHKITQHQPNDPITCDICGREFLNTYSLRGHKSEVHNFKQFACPHCPLMFARQKQFQMHISTHGKGTVVQQQIEQLPLEIVAVGTINLPM